jgi:hypothetical protein
MWRHAPCVGDVVCAADASPAGRWGVVDPDETQPASKSSVADEIRSGWSAVATLG